MVNIAGLSKAQHFMQDAASVGLDLKLSAGVTSC